MLSVINLEFFARLSFSIMLASPIINTLKSNPQKEAVESLKELSSSRFPDFIYQATVDKIDPQELKIYNKVFNELQVPAFIKTPKSIKKSKLSVTKTIKKFPSKGLCCIIQKNSNFFLQTIIS